MLVRRALLFALIIACVPVPTALAQAPKGDWTYVRKDPFRHYACRDRVKGEWIVRTATSWGDKRDDVIKNEFQTYASLARGSDENVADEANSKSWNGGYARRCCATRGYRPAVGPVAAYGPPAPWTNGYTVRRLDLCS